MTTIVVVKKGSEIAIGVRCARHLRRNAAAARLRDEREDLPGAVTPTSGWPAARRTSRCSRRRCVTCGEEVPAGQPRSEVFDTFQRLHPVLKEQLLPQSEGGGQRSLRVVADHRADRQRQRHLRRLLVSRGVQFRPLLGHRLRSQFRARRDVRDATSARGSARRSRRNRRERRHGVRQELLRCRRASSALIWPRHAAARPHEHPSSTSMVPDIGDFKEVEVIEVLVKPGDTVAKEQSLITVESRTRRRWRFRRRPLAS